MSTVEERLTALETRVDALEGNRPGRPKFTVGAFEAGRASLESATGKFFDATRIFKTTQTPPYADVDAALAAGRRVYLSIGSGDMTLVSSAADIYKDADVNLAVLHEPEDNITPAQYVDLQNAARTAIAGRVRHGAILMGWTWDPRSGRNPDAYLQGSFDFIGIDAYMPHANYESAGFPGIIQPALNSALTRSVPLAIAEVGAVTAVNLTPVPETQQRQAIEGLRTFITANEKDIETVLWWETATTADGTTRNYRIAPRPMCATEYAKIGDLR